jgi:hypothetical protein
VLVELRRKSKFLELRNATFVAVQEPVLALKLECVPDAAARAKCRLDGQRALPPSSKSRRAQLAEEKAD